MITNENEFLAMLVKNANNKHEIHHSKAMKLSGLDDEFYLELCKSLKQKGFIQIDSEFITLTLSGMQNVTFTSDKIGKAVSWSAKFTVKLFLEIFIGIVIAAVSAFLIYHFGWQ